MMRTLTTLACLVPVLALGQNTGAPLRGTSLVINDGPGDQTEPHVSGALVAYTSRSSLSTSEIRYHDLVSGVDQAIPNAGAYDSVSDVNGDMVVFTRATSSSRIFRFNARAGGAAEELAPRSGANRHAATVGGQTVAWQEQGYTAASVPPEIFAYRMDTTALTRLSEDTSLDQTPGVSADGQTVVWTKCATGNTGCDIWSARAVDGGYQVSQLTGTQGEETLPDTNGEVVVYVTQGTESGADSDIAWQPVSGGEVHRLTLPGADTNPNISGPLIAFERWDASSATPNFDLMLYDLRTQTYYRLTETPGSEVLSDISVGSDGLVRVVWTARQNGSSNVYAFVFRLPDDCSSMPTSKDPAAVCASPGSRPLLGTLLVSRSTGESDVVSTEVESTGTGVLCVDNGFEGTPATAGWVWLGAGLQVGPDELGHDVTSVARAVPLQGRRNLSAQAEGAPGSAFRVRLYGELSCGGQSEEPLPGTEVRYGQFVPAEPQSTGSDKGGFAHYFVPSGYEGQLPSGAGSETGGPGTVESPAEGSGVEVGAVPDAAPEESRAGCSAGGGSVSLFGVWIFASLLLRERDARARGRVASRR
ncbi:hypothetical protein [Vitiosangium sp. GDMCC 1.1324]|uniref:TolB family protein n=1 Tax=Vitiosangium sp. (strain GDMCC 1.1324) TaxID=2138576 RepID=UPI000D3BB918|nr:hypothetical protein [Vitiosangium sp. GDMCC 1.1324]PTL85245.1 hypothetical protein DAT35_00515 [Vitiosangium sp. GDMCC 1.1324]